MADQVRRVVRQTKARVFAGLTQFPDKLISLFEPHSEIIRKGKAGKPNEFGKLVELQEAENQIITHYEVYEERPSDRYLLLPAVEAHRRKLGRVPEWVAADAGFYSRANEQAAQELGVKYVSIPNRWTRSAERHRWEKRRWFKQGQKWRTGCEGRICVLKRRHGLARCLYHGLHGMRRWVGLGVIADNLINLGRYLAPQPV
jgi:IS5 family transposase